MNRRRLAAALWALLAFLLWNVRFDHGVRQSATRYLSARALYLVGAGPVVELAPMMREGVAESARAATVLAAPVLLLAMVLAAYARRSTGT